MIMDPNFTDEDTKKYDLRFVGHVSNVPAFRSNKESDIYVL